MSKFNVISEYFEFLRINKKWWLYPLVVMILLLGLFIILAKSSVLAPFIYTIF